MRVKKTIFSTLLAFLGVKIWDLLSVVLIQDINLLMSFIDGKCSSYEFRYQNVLQVPQVRTTKYDKKSFRFAAAVLWNSFPDNFRQVSSFNQFKALISNWSGKDCKCNLCR